MDEIKISQLPAAASANGTMEFETNDSGTSKKVTGSQLRTYAQSGLATVATTGAYADLSGKPTLGTAAATDSTAYATAAQGANADTAFGWGNHATYNYVQTTVSYANPSWITSLAYSKLTGAPTAVSAFTNDAGYATTTFVNSRAATAEANALAFAIALG